MNFTRRTIFTALASAFLLGAATTSALAISAGDKVAPGLTAADAGGNTVKLSDVAGPNGSVYILFRSANW